MCRRLRTNCQCTSLSVGTHYLSWHQPGENHPCRGQEPTVTDHVVLNDILMIVALVMELVLRLAQVSDDSGEFIYDDSAWPRLSIGLA